jgi:hypothetical protein
MNLGSTIQFQKDSPDKRRMRPGAQTLGKLTPQCPCRQGTHYSTHTHTHSLSLSHTHTHTHSLSLTHTLTLTFQDSYHSSQKPICNLYPIQSWVLSHLRAPYVLSWNIYIAPWNTEPIHSIKNVLTFGWDVFLLFLLLLCAPDWD